jgi:hypothetical protein
MDDQQHKKFDEYLDELYAPYNIGHLEFWPSDVLKNCDPIAYEVAFGDWQADQEAAE